MVDLERGKNVTEYVLICLSSGVVAQFVSLIMRYVKYSCTQSRKLRLRCTGNWPAHLYVASKF